MSSPWTCPDPFKDRNRLFYAPKESMDSSPLGTSSPGSSPPGFSPPGFSPTGYSSPGYSPLGFSPLGFSPPGFSPPGFSPPGFSPPGFSPTSNHHGTRSPPPLWDLESRTVENPPRGSSPGRFNERPLTRKWPQPMNFEDKNQNFRGNSSQVRPSPTSLDVRAGSSTSGLRRTSVSKQIGPAHCSFCKRNGEVRAVYEMHPLKECVNGKIVVRCPVLRNHKCPICGASGDDAHTITHCPKGSVVVPIAKELKKSCGRRW